MAKTNQQVIVTEGDFGVEILTQFIDTNKKPVPIEGCSCKIKFAYDGNVISEKTGVVIDELKGTVSIILDKEETQYSGLWTSYWVCYDQFNNITTTENIYYYVQPAIGSVNNPAFTKLLNYYNRDEVNDMFKNILEQLNNYTLSKNDVEEYIKIKIINKLSAWKEDGTLENIINQNVFNELNSKVDTFQETVNKMNKCSELHYINNSADEMSVLFKCMNGETVLVDCGETFSSGGVKNRLKALGVTKINHFIITHFHSDHVGGYNMIFDNFIVDNVYFKPITWTLSAKEIEWNTKSLYDGFRLKLNQLNIKYYSLTEDTTISINDNEKIKLMNTVAYPYSDKSGVTEYSVYDYNYESLMCLYTNGNTKVLLQSDCPSQVAYKNYGNTIKNVDHLQISHHGGDDVINSTWINSIRAKTGFYSYLNSTNIEYYKASSFTKLYRYDFNSSTSGCILITDGGLYTTTSMIENKLGDRFLDYLGKKVYIDSSGDMVENGIINNGNKMYIIKDWFKQLPSDDGWCYAIEEQAYALNSDGSIKRNQWVSSGGHNYYVDDQGIYLKNVSYKIGTSDVTFNAEGHANI